MVTPLMITSLRAKECKTHTYLGERFLNYEKLVIDAEKSISLQKSLIDEVWRSSNLDSFTEKEEGLIIEPTMHSYMNFENEFEVDNSLIPEKNIKYSNVNVSNNTCLVDSYLADANEKIRSDTIILSLNDLDDDSDANGFLAPLKGASESIRSSLNPLINADESSNIKGVKGKTHLELFKGEKENPLEEIIRKGVSLTTPFSDVSSRGQESCCIDVLKECPSVIEDADTMDSMPITRKESEDLIFSSVATSPEVVEEPACNLINVKSFKIVGASILSSQHLEALVECYGNQNLTVNELDDVAYVITTAYQSASPLTKAYIFEQDVIDGCIEITVVEPSPGN